MLLLAVNNVVVRFNSCSLPKIVAISMAEGESPCDLRRQQEVLSHKVVFLCHVILHVPFLTLLVVVVVVLLLTTKSHTNRSHVSNIFTCVGIYSINIFVFCKKHDFLLQKGTMKLTTARLNYLHLTLVQRFTL